MIQLPALALLAALSSLGAFRAIAAEDAAPDGTWKLVVLAFGDDVFAIVNLSQQDNTLTASVVDAQRMLLGRPKAKDVELKGDTLTLTLNSEIGPTVFRGVRKTEGARAGQILGTFNFRGDVFPARLEPTRDTKVGELDRGVMVQNFRAAMSERDTQSKIKKLEELIEDNGGRPSNQLLYGALLGIAEPAGLEPDRVSRLIERWTEEASPYGADWLTEVRLKALKRIGASKRFAKLALELATEADKAVTDLQLEQKADVVEFLARAARNCGEEERAKAAESRHAQLGTKLDAEYRVKVPPFKPESYAGRKDSTTGPTVLMELFTGAECGPCIAADVAFDALLQTYKPVDFIGLQYHLHVPGPDPLTNKDSEARRDYYGEKVHGTPATFFNGRNEASGGGPMAGSELKYRAYRAIIDKMLENHETAKITASATRAGDRIKIIASAQMSEKPEGQTAGGGGEKPDETKGKARRMLRLALTEESVRYAGGNKLRFHQHVVRGFPGGTQGKELTDGKGEVEITVSLADLKRNLETYLNDFAQKAPFAKLLPEIKLDGLALVAFIQDDDDQTILQAVSVRVQDANP
jgi:hypothetical protein